LIFKGRVGSQHVGISPVRYPGISLDQRNTIAHNFDRSGSRKIKLFLEIRHGMMANIFGTPEHRKCDWFSWSDVPFVKT